MGHTIPHARPALTTDESIKLIEAFKKALRRKFREDPCNIIAHVSSLASQAGDKELAHYVAWQEEHMEEPLFEERINKRRLKSLTEILNRGSHDIAFLRGAFAETVVASIVESDACVKGWAVEVAHDVVAFPYRSALAGDIRSSLNDREGLNHPEINELLANCRSHDPGNAGNDQWYFGMAAFTFGPPGS